MCGDQRIKQLSSNDHTEMRSLAYQISETLILIRTYFRILPLLKHLLDQNRNLAMLRQFSFSTLSKELTNQSECVIYSILQEVKNLKECSFCFPLCLGSFRLSDSLFQFQLSFERRMTDFPLPLFSIEIKFSSFTYSMLFLAILGLSFSCGNAITGKYLILPQQSHQNNGCFHEHIDVITSKL